jgi:hypothetical protein
MLTLPFSLKATTFSVAVICCGRGRMCCTFACKADGISAIAVIAVANNVFFIVIAVRYFITGDRCYRNNRRGYDRKDRRDRKDRKE